MGKLMLASTQVNHSQKLNEKPLTPWVIALESGKILAAHCNCAAGIGETCSHVASLQIFETLLMGESQIDIEGLAMEMLDGVALVSGEVVEMVKVMCDLLGKAEHRK